MKPTYKFFSAFFLTSIIPIIGLTQNNKHFNSVGYAFKPISKIEENKKKIIEYLKSNPELVLNSQSTQSERSIAFSTREYSIDNQQTLNFDSTRLHYFSANVGWLFTFNENENTEIFGVDTALTYTYSNGILVKSSRFTFQYNSSGFNISQTEDTLVGNTWNLVSTTTITRNSSNKVVSQISNPPFYKTENTYSATNYLLT